VQSPEVQEKFDPHLLLPHVDEEGLYTQFREEHSSCEGREGKSYYH
jgi:hypothetical protein